MKIAVLNHTVLAFHNNNIICCKNDKHVQNPPGVPDYLLNIIPKKREHVSSYNTRNKEDYIIPRCRLQLFGNSFIPDAVKQWNLLKVEVREAISINSFRKNLELKVESSPSFFLLSSDIQILFIQN